MEEIWKDIPNYEGIYQASNYGRIKRIKNGYIQNNYIDKRDGYCHTTLSYKGKNKVYQTHRIIAMTFIDNPDNKPVVNHIDGNKTNNNVNNLEWCTHQENVIHARDVLKIDFSNGIDITHEKSKKKVIRSDGKIYNSIDEAKKDINNKNAHICEVCKGKLKTACGYGWKYYCEG